MGGGYDCLLWEIDRSKFEMNPNLSAIEQTNNEAKCVVDYLKMTQVVDKSNAAAILRHEKCFSSFQDL